MLEHSDLRIHLNCIYVHTDFLLRNKINVDSQLMALTYIALLGGVALEMEDTKNYQNNKLLLL